MESTLTRLEHVLSEVPERIVACSGGVDSLLLATVAHRSAPESTIVAHAVTPAVPGAATGRVAATAGTQGWDLRQIRSTEFDDEQYLANPVDRCYHCKTHLYSALDEIATHSWAGSIVLSGANTDDLGEYRPGLIAAAEHRVRHPYVEAGISKAELRQLARDLDLEFADLPAAPCLASRLYTGTRVTPGRLQAIEAGEELIRQVTGVGVVRCRLRDDTVSIEVNDTDRDLLTEDLVAAVSDAMTVIEPTIAGVEVDEEAYRPGRAFITVTGS